MIGSDAILQRTEDFITGEAPDTGTSTGDCDTSTNTDSGNDTSGTGTTTPATGSEDSTDTTPATGDITLSAAGGDVSAQGWTLEGTTVTSTANTVTSSGGTLAQNVQSIVKQSGATWTIDHPTTTEPTAILTNGGEFFCRFRITDSTSVDSRYAMGIYWIPSSVPDGVAFNRTGDGMSPSLLNMYVQTDSSGIMNLCMHCSTKSASNLQVATVGAFDNNWHTISMTYQGNSTARATLVVDGTTVGDLTLACAPTAASASDVLHLTSITLSDIYSVEIERLAVTVNAASATA